jgi:ABC-type Fe3+ transport system permease subunit
MRPIRMILALAAGAYALSQYWQERKRFAKLRSLPVRDALARHERTRKSAERSITLAAAIVCVCAAALAVYAFAVLPNPVANASANTERSH